MEIECPLRSAAGQTGAEPALITPDRTFTFAQLDEQVSLVAAKLGDMKGSRLALLLDNGWPLIVIILGAIRAGLVACPLSTRLPPAALKTRVKQIGARHLVTDRSEIEETIAPGDLLTGDRASHAEGGIFHSPDQPATIVFTSGSTGEPRGALHTYGNHYFSALGSNQNIAIGPGDRWLLSLPLYHVGGLAILFRCLTGRATVRVPAPDHPADEQLSDVTHASMVATQLRRVLERPTDYRLKAILLGGSAMPDGLVKEAHARRLPIHTSYGLSEMASQVATTPPGASLEELQTSGRVLPHRELRIDAEGEIHVRGRTRFAGYVDGERIRRPFDNDGWFATGDLGEIDDEGWLRVVGRKDNMFISGGENIQPEEIESALMALSGVRRAVVVPVHNAEFGRRPVAFVEMDGGRLDERLLREQLAERLPSFMLPDVFYAWPGPDAEGELKVDRDALRQRAESRRDR